VTVVDDDGLDGVFTEVFGLFEMAWDAAENAERRRRHGRLKRWTVCWWKHGTREIGAGVYESRWCRACAP
jgi:hypothetical protein